MSCRRAFLRGSVRLVDEADATESARLIRAAVAYSGKELSEIASGTGIKYATLRNYTSVSRPTKATLEKRLRIAEACGVPPWFMEAGFVSEQDDDANVAARVHRLEAQVAKLQTAVVTLAADSLRRTRGQQAPGDTGRGQEPPAAAG